MPGPWKITCNYIDGEKRYQVYRLLDEDAVDHSGNRETIPVVCADRRDAEDIVWVLNDVGLNPR